MLPHFLLPSNSKLLEDELIEIILQLIPAGWKYTMTCANFKPLEHSMETLVKYLEGVECSENKNLPKRNNWNSSNSSVLKKTKKQKHKHDKGEEFHNVTVENASNKKSCKPYKFYKMFGGNAESHTTDCCNKKNLLSSLLDEHKKKCMDKVNKEEFCAMVKAFKKASIKRKKAYKRLIHNFPKSESFSDEE
eukprot:12219003-Ditylum_brightwellii.AAC.1